MKKIIILVIMGLALFLRTYKLTSYPAGFNADEAALGYNAYSLMLTGKDEHGNSWPVNLESFGDYKPALYAYILIPFIKILGLTELAVRLPTAIFGVAAVGLIYLFVRDIFSQKLGLIAAVLLAISPWHIHFSRGGWEVNMATTFILGGVWFFIRWTKSNRFIQLAISVICLVMAMYAYQSARVIAPALGLGLVIMYGKDFVKFSKQSLMAGLLLMILLLPLGISVVRTDAGSRLSGVGLLADEGPLNRAQELRGQHSDWNHPFARVLHNRAVTYSIRFVENYLSHFNGNFLFVNGDQIERNKVPETGLLYLTDAAFLVLGAIYLLRSKNLNARIIWLWLLVAPLASAMTFQTPHALRAQNMVIPLTIIIATGIGQIINKKVLLLVALIYAYQFARYLHEYYIHYPQTYPAAWEYGFKQLAAFVKTNQSRYDKVYITDKYDQPYILLLFYLKYPPAQFQNNHQLTLRDKFNFSTVRQFDKFYFENTPWDKMRDVHSSLIIVAPEDIPEVGVNIVKTINFPNGQPAFKIISN